MPGTFPSGGKALSDYSPPFSIASSGSPISTCHQGKHESIVLCCICFVDRHPTSKHACRLDVRQKKQTFEWCVQKQPLRNKKISSLSSTKSLPHVYLCVCEHMFTSTLLTVIHPDMCIDSASSVHKRCIHTYMCPVEKLSMKLMLTSTLPTAIHPDLCIDSVSS